MKKLMLVLTSVTTLLGTAAHAQKKGSDDGVTFGIRAGVNFQNITGKDDNGTKLDNKMLTGFHAGVNAELPITEKIYLQPGLLFTTKGAKSKTDASTGSTNLSYIELPVNVVYKMEAGDGHLIFGVGPYAAYGITGKVKYSGGGVDVNKSIKFKNSVSFSDYISSFGAYVKPFDFGLNILAGYELSSNISVQLNGQLGFANLVPNIEGVTTNAKAKNTGFGVSFGYRF